MDVELLMAEIELLIREPLDVVNQMKNDAKKPLLKKLPEFRHFSSPGKNYKGKGVPVRVSTLV